MDDKHKDEFKKLLEYQEKDKQLRLINKTIEGDENLAKKNAQEKLFNIAKQKLSECDEKAAKTLANYESLKSYVDEIEGLLSEIKNSDIDGLNEEELSAELKKMDSLLSKISNADKRTSDIEKQIPALVNAKAEAITSGKAAKAQYKEASEKHENLIAQKADDVKKIKAEIDKLRAGIDKSYLDKYDEIISSGKYPAVVPARLGDKKGQYSCGGCGMGLSQQANGQINSAGWCKCNTCGRIIIDMKNL